MAISVTKCEIDGLFEVQPRVFGDERGFFLETWNERDYAAAGIPARFVQDNMSFSKKGVLRGLHFQKTHPQGKLVRAVQGEVFDVAVDLRVASQTFGKWRSVVLSGKKQNQFYIPPGFAHGFLVLSEEALFSYKCTDFYHPEDEGGLIWNDKNLNIAWPAQNPVIAEKDAKWPDFARFCAEKRDFLEKNR